MQNDSTFKSTELREEANNLKSDVKDAAQSFKNDFNKEEVHNKIDDIRRSTSDLIDKAEEKISNAYAQTKNTVGHIVHDMGEALGHAYNNFSAVPEVVSQPVGTSGSTNNAVVNSSTSTSEAHPHSAFETLKENAVNLIYKAEEKLSSLIPSGTFGNKQSALEPPTIEGVTQPKGTGFTQPQTTEPTKQIGTFNSPNNAIELTTDFNAKPIVESERNNVNIPETEHVSKNMKLESESESKSELAQQNSELAQQKSEPKPSSFIHRTEETISHAFTQTKGVTGHLVQDVENALGKAYNVTKDAAGSIMHNPTFSSALTGAENTLGNAFNATKGAISNALKNKSNTLEPPFIEGVSKSHETTNQNNSDTANQQGTLKDLKIGAENFLHKAEETFSKVFEQTKTAAGHMVQDAENALGGAFTAAKETTDKAVHAASDKFSNVANITKDTASSMVHTAENSLSGAFNTTKDFSGNLLHTAENKLGNAFLTTKDTISSTFGTKQTTLEPPFIEGVSGSGDFAGSTLAIANENDKSKKLFD